MKILIVEDDSVSRIVLQKMLGHLGTIHTAVNGHEAIAFVKSALEEKQPYDLICLDIMMPMMDGQETLRWIRLLEQQKQGVGNGAKIIMTTALSDLKNVKEAYHHLCDDYLVKPIKKEKLLESLEKLGLCKRPLSASLN